MQKEALERLLKNAADFVGHVPGTIPDKDWLDFLKSRHITYTGDIVKNAQEISWDQIAAALPPVGCCGRIPILDIATGPVRDYWEGRSFSMVVTRTRVGTSTPAQ